MFGLRESPNRGEQGLILPHPLVRLRVNPSVIRKLKSGEYRLYSRNADPKTGKRRNLGTFASRGGAEKHEREVQYFKRH
jgi:hypothetical protein